MDNNPSSKLVEPLSKRDIEILRLLNEGLSNQEIANTLFLSLDTVKWYNQQIFGKLGVSSRTQAVLKAREYRLVNLAESDAGDETGSGWHNLPAPLNAFIGRHNELADIQALLRAGDIRLVTILGPGGIGKTRLALRVAEETRRSYPHGVWMVDLTPVTEGKRVAEVVAECLGLQSQGFMDYENLIIRYIKDRKLLLVLDNCEHLVEACTRLVTRLLKACAGLRILATSREKLRVEGEAQYALSSLPFPGAQARLAPEEIEAFAAVELFKRRAELVSTGFTIDVANAPAVAKICQRLDGIPLAIELSAAWVDVLSVTQIAAWLDDSLTALVDGSGSRASPPRHQTLRASLDWSYSMLIDGERRLLHRLSVFAGGWTLEAAQYTCGYDGLPVEAVLADLRGLVGKSLVAAGRRAVEGGDEMRYTLHETLRQYASQKLLDQEGDDLVRGRHLEYFLRLAEQAEPELRGPRQQAWMRRLENELENIRASLAWALDGARPRYPEDGLRLACALTMFWVWKGLGIECLAWLEKGLAWQNEAGALSPVLRARCSLTAGSLYYSISDFKKAALSLEEGAARFRELGEERYLIQALGGWAVALVWNSEFNRAVMAADEGEALARRRGDESDLADMLLSKGNVYCLDDETRQKCMEESLALYEKTGNWPAVDGPLQKLGFLAVVRGDYALARSYLLKTLAICGENRKINSAMWCQSLLGDLAFREGDYSQMEAWFQECLASARITGFTLAEVWSINHCGVAARRLGQIRRALPFFRECLEYAQEYQQVWSLWDAIQGMAGLALDTGRPLLAARLLGAFDASYQSIRGIIPTIELARDRAALEASLGESVLLEAWDAGRQWTLEEALPEAARLADELARGWDG